MSHEVGLFEHSSVLVALCPKRVERPTSLMRPRLGNSHVIKANSLISGRPKVLQIELTFVPEENKDCQQLLSLSEVKKIAEHLLG